MDPDAIFALIVKADERLKYARAGDPAATQAARELLERARDEARAASLQDLAAQAELRLADLGE